MTTKPKKKSVFYKVYFTLLALFFIALIIFLIWLGAWIRRYDKTLPETASKRIFNELFIDGNVKKLRETTGIEASPFETEENITAYLDGLLEGGTLTYSSISGHGDDDSIKNYIVIKTPDGADESAAEKVATFTLKRGSDNIYVLDSFALRQPIKSSHTFEVLNGSKLYLNEVEVTDEYRSDAAPSFRDVSSLVGEGVPGTRGVVYTVPDMICPPEVKVIDRNGRETSLDENGREVILYDEDEAFAAFVLTAAKQYAACMQSDASKASVLKYYERGTDLYHNIETEENYFVWDHNGYSFEDENVSEICSYDDKTVSARVSFTHILRRAGTSDYRDHIDITFFAHRQADGSFLIFAMNNG